MTIGEAQEQIRLLRDQVKNLAEESHVWQQRQAELTREQWLAYVQGVSTVCRELWEGLAAAGEMLQRIEAKVGPEFELEE